MPTIRPLSQSMINKIAAGEVVERPASVVKELLENSLDAGASRVDVTVEEGGCQLIRIVDNGCGIAADELSLAISPHATSKIHDTDDLFKILSFGFRGEALASIAEISQFYLKSRTADNDAGAEIRSNGGNVSGVTPIGAPVGTTIEIRNLFFNVPVRRKFLRTCATEFGHVQEAFLRIAIPHWQTHLTLTHQGKTVYDLPVENGPIDRIARLFTPDIARQLIYIENRPVQNRTDNYRTDNYRAGELPQGEIGISGFVSHPQLSRNNNRLQYFFLNRRHVRDRALQHALAEAYKGLLTVGRFPIVFLNLDMSPEFVDVNVHPTKMEVRFLDSQRVYNRFLGTLRERFLTLAVGTAESCHSIGTPSMTPPVTQGITPYSVSPMGHGSGTPSESPQSVLQTRQMEDVRRSVMDWAAGLPPEQNTVHAVHTAIFHPNTGQNQGQSPPSPLSSPSAAPSSGSAPLRLHTFDNPYPIQIKNREPVVSETSGTGSGTEPEKPVATPPETMSENTIENTTKVTPSQYMVSSVENEPPARPNVLPVPKMIQLHDRYLVLETEKGIGIIDQHALHERLLYQKLQAELDSGPLTSQRLLVPHPMDLTPSEAACVRENSSFLSSMGFQTEPFGGDTILITGYPSVLGRIRPDEALESVLTPLMESGKRMTPSELTERMLHSMACKAAVKAGEKLHDDAVAALSDIAMYGEHSRHCPHGRPAVIFFTCEELNRMFKRV